ncbi:MAG: hypothetical protein R3350_04330, partial [Saprospiraceae bacterium]|nr:hypothetical protein [Saprospiraceae bacterium]
MTCILLILLLLSACSPAREEAPTDQLESYYRAMSIIRSALDAQGSLPSEGIVLQGRGKYDLSIRLQGMHPDSSQPVAMREVIAYDPLTQRTVYESQARVNQDAEEWIRYDYDGSGRMLFMERNAGFAFWDAHVSNLSSRQRYARLLPQNILREALKQRATLVFLGRDARAWRKIAFECTTGELLSLTFDDSNRLKEVSCLIDMPLLGDSQMTWKYDEYQALGDTTWLPRSYRVLLNEKELKAISFQTPETGLE